VDDEIGSVSGDNIVNGRSVADVDPLHERQRRCPCERVGSELGELAIRHADHPMAVLGEGVEEVQPDEACRSGHEDASGRFRFHG